MVSRFRLMRIYCHIQLKEVAEAAGISSQRLNQCETRYDGYMPKNPEWLISVLESIIEQRKQEIEDVEYICQHERETIFDFVKGGEDL